MSDLSIAPWKDGDEEQSGGAVVANPNKPRPSPLKAAMALNHVEWERLRVWVNSKRNVISQQRWTPEEAALIAINHKIVKACNGQNIREISRYVGVAFADTLVDPLMVPAASAA